MNMDEYCKRHAKLQSAYKKETAALVYEFAMSNNKVEIGDIVIARGRTIRVEHISPSTALDGIPRCKYTGPRLRKDLKPYKTDEVADVYQQNIRRVIKHD